MVWTCTGTARNVKAAWHIEPNQRYKQECAAEASNPGKSWFREVLMVWQCTGTASNVKAAWPMEPNQRYKQNCAAEASKPGKPSISYRPSTANVNKKCSRSVSPCRLCLGRQPRGEDRARSSHLHDLKAPDIARLVPTSSEIMRTSS